MRINFSNGSNPKLYDVRVYRKGINVARSAGATAAQSSTSGSQNASLAVDKLYSTYSLTNDTQAYWEVTLDTADTGYVKEVWISTDIPSCRYLNGSLLILYDGSNNKVATRTLRPSCDSTTITEFFSPACTCEYLSNHVVTRPKLI